MMKSYSEDKPQNKVVNAQSQALLLPAAGENDSTSPAAERSSAWDALKSLFYPKR